MFHWGHAIRQLLSGPFCPPFLFLVLTARSFLSESHPLPLLILVALVGQIPVITKGVHLSS